MALRKDTADKLTEPPAPPAHARQSCLLWFALRARARAHSCGRSRAVRLVVVVACAMAAVALFIVVLGCLLELVLTQAISVGGNSLHLSSTVGAFLVLIEASTQVFSVVISIASLALFREAVLFGSTFSIGPAGVEYVGGSLTAVIDELAIMATGVVFTATLLLAAPLAIGWASTDEGPEPSWGFFFQILRFLFGWMPLAMAVVPAVGITATVTLVVLLRLAVVLATSLRRKEFTGALAGRLRPHLKHAQAQVEVEAMHAAAAAAAVSSSSTPSLKTAAAAQVEVERAAMKVAQSRVELWVTSKICLYFLTPSARHFSTNSGSAILVHCFGLIVANAALLSYLNGTTPTSLAISGDGDSNGAIVFCIVCILFPLVLMVVFTAPYAAWIRSVLQLQAQRWTIRYKRRAHMHAFSWCGALWGVVQADSFNDDNGADDSTINDDAVGGHAHNNFFFGRVPSSTTSAGTACSSNAGSDAGHNNFKVDGSDAGPECSSVVVDATTSTSTRLAAPTSTSSTSAPTLPPSSDVAAVVVSRHDVTTDVAATDAPGSAPQLQPQSLHIRTPPPNGIVAALHRHGSELFFRSSSLLASATSLKLPPVSPGAVSRSPWMATSTSSWGSTHATSTSFISPSSTGSSGAAPSTSAAVAPPNSAAPFLAVESFSSGRGEVSAETAASTGIVPIGSSSSSDGTQLQPTAAMGFDTGGGTGSGGSGYHTLPTPHSQSPRSQVQLATAWSRTPSKGVYGTYTPCVLHTGTALYLAFLFINCSFLAVSTGTNAATLCLILSVGIGVMWCFPLPRDGCCSMTWRALLACTAVMFLAFGAVYGEAVHNKAKWDPVITGVSSVPTPAGASVYPVCSLSVNGLTAVEHCMLAAAVYGNTSSARTAISTWFPGGTSVLSPLGGWNLTNVSIDLAPTPRYLVMANAVTNATVLVFRGTSTPDDWLHNADMWRESVVLQMASRFTPVAFFSASVLRTAIWLSWQAVKSISSDTSLPDVLTHALSVVDGVLSASAPGTVTTLTGHSLGGGLSSLCGGLRSLKSVSFSGPGWYLSSVKFGVSRDAVDQISEGETVILPEGDVVPRIDIHNGLVQNTFCNRTNNFLQCHSIVHTCCELLRSCGDPMGRTFQPCRY